MDYDSEQLWQSLQPEIVATTISKSGGIRGHEREPTKISAGRWSGGTYWSLSCLALENLPPWEKSLRLRPPVRGSKAYWDDAPDWAQASFIAPGEREYWTSNVEVFVRDDHWVYLSGKYEHTGRTYPSDHWQESKLIRPYVWQLPDENTPVDTPALARRSSSGIWELRHYASPGKCYKDGRTRYSSGGDKGVGFVQIVLADPNDPSRVPPMDLTLGLET